jgi:hypothetical protein
MNNNMGYCENKCDIIDEIEFDVNEIRKEIINENKSNIPLLLILSSLI